VISKVTTRRITELDDLLGEILETIWRERDRYAPVGADILVWRMTGFGNPESVQEGIKRSRKYKTLILDLRNNGGGTLTALSELVSRTFDREVVVSMEKQRKKERTEKAKPKDGFGGKLIVLVDSRSASAAEMYARIVQLEKRGTVIGDRTAGMVMMSQFFPHTVGIGAVAFYATSITVGDVRMSDGGSLEKIGVTPDEIALPTPADMAAGRDPVLARAVALAGGRITPDEAAKLLASK